MRKAVGVRFACCLLLGVAARGLTQNTNAGDIRGTLTDPFGTIAPGATVTRTDNDPGASRDYVTSNPCATILGPLLRSRALPIWGIVLLSILSFDLGLNHSALSPKELSLYTQDWFIAAVNRASSEEQFAQPSWTSSLTGPIFKRPLPYRLSVERDLCPLGALEAR